MRICFALLFLFCGCTQSQLRQSLVAVPDNLKPPSNERPILQANADGDQIYDPEGHVPNVGVARGPAIAEPWPCTPLRPSIAARAAA
jgi:hypothetical protein